MLLDLPLANVRIQVADEVIVVAVVVWVVVVPVVHHQPPVPPSTTASGSANTSVPLQLILPATIAMTWSYFKPEFSG